MKATIFAVAAVLLLSLLMPLAEAVPAYRCGTWYKNSAFGAASPGTTISVQYAQTACISLGTPAWNHCYPFYCQSSWYGTGYCQGSASFYQTGSSSNIWSCFFMCTNSPSCNVPFFVNLNTGTSYKLQDDGGINSLIWYNPCPCVPNTQSTVGTCGACNEGTLVQSCDANCNLGTPYCTGAGNCNVPGQTQNCNQCGTQTCNPTTCMWGSCTGTSATQVKDCDYLDAICRDYHDCTKTCGSDGNWVDCTCTYTDLTDDTRCGSISCAGWYQADSTDTSATATQNCYSTTPLTTNRCSGGSCKAPNTQAACSGLAANTNDLKYSCGICKYIPSGQCTGTTLGACASHSDSTDCGGGNQCLGGVCMDGSPPQVSVTYSYPNSPSPPSSPTTNDAVTITATATDDDGITKIQIYSSHTTQNNGLHDCIISPSQTPATCSWNIGTLSAGTYYYYATAWDVAPTGGGSNQVSSPVNAPTQKYSFQVIPYTAPDIIPPVITVTRIGTDTTPTPFFATYPDVDPNTPTGFIPVSFTTDESATCKASGTTGSFSSMTGTGTSMSTTHTVNVDFSGFQADSNASTTTNDKTVYIACQDSNQNENVTSQAFKYDGTPGYYTSPATTTFQDVTGDPTKKRLFVTVHATDPNSNIEKIKYKLCRYEVEANPNTWTPSGSVNASPCSPDSDLRTPDPPTDHWINISLQSSQMSVSYTFEADWDPSDSDIDPIPASSDCCIVKYGVINGAGNFDEVGDPIAEANTMEGTYLFKAIEDFFRGLCAAVGLC